MNERVASCVAMGSNDTCQSIKIRPLRPHVNSFPSSGRAVRRGMSHLTMNNNYTVATVTNKAQRQHNTMSSKSATQQLSEAQQALLKELNVNFKTGLTNDEASKRREETFNRIDPPIKCPGWVCCLLPCIKSIPSMKAFRQLQPEDAEIRRNGKWTRYDASSVVRGDVLRLEEGDVVPADVVVLKVTSHDLLVDVHGITGEEKPRVIVSPQEDPDLAKLYYGGLVLQGSCIAVATAIGPNTLLATCIREGKFPPTGVLLLEPQDEDAEQGISLISRTTIS